MKVFYTNAGCTLVALNPFQPIPDLYSLDMMREYHCAPQPQVFTKSQLTVTEIHLPYIYIYIFQYSFCLYLGEVDGGASWGGDGKRGWIREGDVED